MSAVTIIFPHQLFEQQIEEAPNKTVWLVEEHLFFKQFNFHKVKIAFHRASMKKFQARMEEAGIEVNYVQADQKISDIRELIPQLTSEGVKSITYVDPTDFWLNKRIKKAAEDNDVELKEKENPLFLNSRDELSDFFKSSKKSFFQTTFYKKERQKRDILIEGDGEPAGGKWTYDTENRKKYPKDKEPPVIAFPDQENVWSEAKEYVENHFKDNPGQVSENPIYPLDREAALGWLQQFFEKRFDNFGVYEDAIVRQESFLNHSCMTPMMNVGMVLPGEVLQRALDYADEHDIPLNSLEGFVRQIMGWREFIRGMYECKGVESRTRNYWGFDRKIPASFYDGSTGIEPIDHTIKKILKTGYCHHIERLMILGNFMLLCEFDPKEVYRWFMELFIDAYDWVMVPNVYGMSQFADGGFFATKPYISGSNYLMKMSDYKKGDWQGTWDGLFWRFMDTHRDFFTKNPRLGMLVGTFDKMSKEKQEGHHQAAASYLEKIS
ncbi:MAG: cryptochrome/photolyase family protein [Bacteroidota bacterium]